MNDLIFNSIDYFSFALSIVLINRDLVVILIGTDFFD